VQLSPFSCYFIPLWSKYSPQNPVLKHLQSVRLIMITGKKRVWRRQHVAVKFQYIVRATQFLMFTPKLWIKTMTQRAAFMLIPPISQETSWKFTGDNTKSETSSKIWLLLQYM
jgi:hypothetical protein